MPTDEEIRRRREQKGKEYAARTAPVRRRQIAKTVVLALGGALALGGVVAGYVILQPEPDVHIHPNIHAYVNGTRADFSDRSFDMGETGYMRGHLHLPSTSKVHVEGRPGLTIGEFFKNGLYGSGLGSGHIQFDGRVRPVNVTGYQEWPAQLWVLERGGEWRLEGGDPADHEFVDEERLLLVYGPATDEELALWKDFIERDG